MAHSTFYNHSLADQIDDEEEDHDDVTPVMQYRNLKTSDAIRVKKEEARVRSRSSSGTRTRSNSRASGTVGKVAVVPDVTKDPRSLTPEYIQEDIKRHEKYLKPSPLVDESLARYNKSFSEFLKSNPQIERDSPKLAEHDRTLVVLSPYSAEHAFGRKWLGKSYLATIFERPQRLLAACIGISAAVSMYPFFFKIVNSQKKGSVFSPHVQKIHGKNWPRKLYELCLASQEKLDSKNLEVPEDWNTGDIYLIPRTINAIEGVIGTIEAAIDAMFTQSYSLSFVVIRPPGHHSHACLPSGFCLLNNVQIGIEYAFDTYGVSHVAIVDIDLHHGDGSQDICWERAGFTGDFGKSETEDNELGLDSRDEYGKRFAKYPKVGYFSLHDIKSYPTELGYATRENIKNASTCIMDHDLNIWNVHLQEWDTEEEFYKHYQTKYVSILNRVNQFLHQAKQAWEEDGVAADRARDDKQDTGEARETPDNRPKEFKPLIIISAGFDASEYENPQMQRHGINVPTSFYSKFTNDIVKLSKIHGSKVVSFLEGGYSDGALTTGVFSHLIGLTNSVKHGNLWNETWGTEVVMKELIRGCKVRWGAYKSAASELNVWANEVIKLGRLMMPNAILAKNYVYEYKEEEEEVVVERHTRSYYKKDVRQDAGRRV